MLRKFDDEAVVNAFVKYLRQHGHPGLRIERRPEKENRNSEDIEAAAGPFAIEHTSVDTVANQTRNSAWFLQVVGGLESELSPRLNYRLRITLPYEGIRRGQDWPSMRRTIVEWILDSSSKLRDGRYVINNVAGIPFEFRVNKASNQQPGLFFRRPAPEDSSFSNRLQNQLSRKAKKLRPYQEKGFTTILLVESDDIALMDEDLMLDGIRKALSGNLFEGVDQIWYADTSTTSTPKHILFYDFTKCI